MKFVQILYNKAHWIFEANVKPDFPPDPEGNPIILVDITGRTDITEGMDYDAETGIFTEPVIEIPEYEPEPIPPTEQEVIQAMQLSLAIQTAVAVQAIQQAQSPAKTPTGFTPTSSFQLPTSIVLELHAVKSQYDRGLLANRDIANLVLLSHITKEMYNEITGEDYYD